MKNAVLILLIFAAFSSSAQNDNSTTIAKDAKLTAELEMIHDSDQGIRKQYRSTQKEHGFDNPEVYALGLKMNSIDSLNLIKVIDILDSKGWVGKSVVGSKANEALFLVIQHANIDTQNKYLPLMREAAKNGDASLSSLALLEDRIALREGRYQIYGSQIASHPTTKEYYVLPLADPDNVDERRATMKLGPLKEYVANWEIVWDTELYKKNLPEYEKLLKENISK